ncbi:MAG TPA: translation initiation factor IF-2 [Limnochordales bacterium]
MAKVRVYELARDLGVDSKLVVDFLASLGQDVKNHMSTVEDEYVARVRRHFGAPKAAAAAGASGNQARPGTAVAPGSSPRPAAAPAAGAQQARPAASAAGAGGQPVRAAAANASASTTQARPAAGGAGAAANAARPATARPQAPQPVQGSPAAGRPGQVKPAAPGAQPGRTPQAQAAAARPAAVDPRRQATQVARPAQAQQAQGQAARPAPAQPAQAQAARPAPAQPAQAQAARPAQAQAARGGQAAAAQGRADQAGGRSPQGKARHKGPAGPQRQAPPEPGSRGKLELPDNIAIKDLAGKVGVPAAAIVKYLFNQGIMATVNQSIDFETAAKVASRLGFEVVRPRDPIADALVDLEDPPEKLQPIPPVVTIMGHVDHGKTTLLDAIRETRVAASEAGGITQHIGAYQVHWGGKAITFLDTPGHEAFTAMRSRGAQVTDIAVLVVAADDGVMPQTVEAINHAKAANVPIIVAINKIDKPDANPDRVKQQLAEYGLLPEEWGGDTVMVPVSALKRQGLDELLEMILLVAELRELKANPDRPARGVIIEAELDKGRGPVATVLVKKGTLRLGDAVVAGHAAGKVRAMLDDRGQPISEAGPATPVSVLGLDDVPAAGDELVVVADERIGREIAERRRMQLREQEMQRPVRANLEALFQQVQEGQLPELPIIIKGDVQGSVEALRGALEKLSRPEVRLNVIHAGVGAITKTDVDLAAAANAIIIGFNVRPDATARKVAEQENVDIRLYRVIYDAIEEMERALEGMLAPEVREVVLGRAEVRALFRVPNVGTVAGCYVTEGKIVRGAQVRVIRDGTVVHEGPMSSLKRFKDDVREVTEGYECGIGLERFQDLKEGDILEAFRMEEVARDGR